MERIHTDRLELVSLDEGFLTATIEGDVKRAQARLGARVPSPWFREVLLASARLQNLRDDPTIKEWLLRAVVRPDREEMVGHVGFHSRPGPADLEAHLPGGVELGYEIFEAHQRRGYGQEAVAGLMGWAHRAHGQSSFMVAIAPGNQPSLALARKLGFSPIGHRAGVVHPREQLLSLRL